MVVVGQGTFSGGDRFRMSVCYRCGESLFCSLSLRCHLALAAFYAVVFT